MPGDNGMAGYYQVMSEVNGAPTEPAGGLAGVLVPHAISGGIGKDAALLRRAIAEGWDVPEHLRSKIVKRCDAIVSKETVSVPCGEGTIDSDYMADRNALAAGGLVRDMLAHNQRERFKAADLEQSDRHHREGSKVHSTSQVFMLVADARGTTRAATADDIRAAAGLETAEAPCLPAPGVPEPGPQPGCESGSAGRQDPA